MPKPLHLGGEIPVIRPLQTQKLLPIHSPVITLTTPSCYTPINIINLCSAPTVDTRRKPKRVLQNGIIFPHLQTWILEANKMNLPPSLGNKMERMIRSQRAFLWVFLLSLFNLDWHLVFPPNTRNLIYHMRLKLDLSLMEHYERHCPPPESRYNCLIPPPSGYKSQSSGQEEEMKFGKQTYLILTLQLRSQARTGWLLKVEAEEQPKISKAYSIYVVPYFVFFKVTLLFGITLVNINNKT